MKRAVIIVFLLLLSLLIGDNIGARENSQGTESRTDKDLNILPPQSGKVKPELVIQNGHSDSVSSAAYSGDGILLATASEDKIIKLWNVVEGRLIRDIRGNTARVYSLAFSPDGRMVLSGSEDGCANLFDILTGKLLKTLHGDNIWISSVAFSPDGKIIATGGSDSIINLWDPSTGSCIRTLEGHQGWIRSIAFSPDGRRLVSGAGNPDDRKDDSVRIWDVERGACLLTLKGHSENITSVAFSPAGRVVASGSSDKTVKLWDASSGACLKNLAGHSEGVLSISFSPSGKLLASGSLDRSIKIWDCDTGTCIATIDKGISVSAIAFSPDGKTLVTGDSIGNVEIWSTSSWSPLFAFVRYSQWVQSLSFSPDGRILSLGRHFINPWALFSGMPLMEIRGKEIEAINSLVYSPDGRTIITGTIEKAVHIWDAQSGALIRTLNGHTESVKRVAISPDGKKIASGSADKTVRMWDSSTGACLFTLSGHSGIVSSVAFSHDGKILASGDWDGMVKLWDAASGKLLQTLHHQDFFYIVCQISFSPDDRYIASADGDNVIRIWNSAQGKCEKTLEGHTNSVNSVAFSPDGSTIASGGNDNTVRIWSAGSGALLRTLQGHTGDVYGIAFSPAGNRIASGSSDTTARIWDAQSGELLASLINFDDGGWIVYSPEGYFDCSEHGKQHIGWTVGIKNYPLEQFYDEFYTPGLLSLVEKGERFAKKHDLRLGFASPPEMSIQSPCSGDKVEKEMAEVVVSARDTGGGIDDVRLYNQEKLVASGKDLKITPGRGGSRMVSFLVQLAPGENVLKATAYNKDHSVESLPCQIRVRYDAARNNARVFILSVGINKYRESSLDLLKAREDAETIADCLKRRGEKIFAGESVTLLCDDQATKSNIIQEMKKISAEARPEDVVIIFLSGHGETDPSDGRYYFIPYDFSTSGDINAIFRNSGVSDSTFGDITREMKANKILVIFDTCHSGKATVAFRSLAELKAMKMLAKSYGLHVLAASKDEQLAGEVKELGHGIFTYAIIEGLEGKADGNSDNVITVRELLPYVEQRVEELSEQYLGRRQFPVVDSRGMDFPLIVK